MSFISFCIKIYIKNIFWTAAYRISPDFPLWGTKVRFLVPGTSRWVSNCTTGTLWRVFLTFLKGF